MGDSQAPLTPEHFFHIYNRSNNSEIIFKSDQNYNYFLKQWNKYLDNYAEVWAYCLIPNHFHFLIRIYPIPNFQDQFEKSNYKTVPKFLSNQFRKLFISYTKSFNKMFDRSGSLFQKPFKRVKVDSQQYLQHLIHYIHHNPIHHNVTQSYKNWKYSSFSAILSQHKTDIPRQKVLDLFDGRKSFISHHQEMKNYNKINHIIID